MLRTTNFSICVLGSWQPDGNHTQNFPYEKHVSEFGVEGLWMVGWMCILEYLVLWLQNKPLPPPHENLLSLAHGIGYYLTNMWIRSIEFLAYVWLWRNYALFPTLCSDSLGSYLGTIILIDFFYYWFHRMSHEVMLFWAIHQVHHSSVNLTVSVGLRHSVLQSFFSWVFYLPLAFIGLPVCHLMAHLQLNLLYQTWIHTEAIDKLGFLEYVFNTPSHHRIHHGILPHSIDKNYGGVFIFWDFLFGTFQREIQNENIYGIIYQPEKWNIPFYQIFYLKQMVSKAKSMATWKDCFATVWKGPSWVPGASRLGREFNIDYDYSFNKTRQKVNSSTFINVYTSLHLVTTVFLLSNMTGKMGLNVLSMAVYSILILAELTNIGLIYERRPMAIQIEVYRCLAGFLICLEFPIASGGIQFTMLLIFGMSWVFLACTNNIGFKGAISRDIVNHKLE